MGFQSLGLGPQPTPETIKHFEPENPLKDLAAPSIEKAALPLALTATTLIVGALTEETHARTPAAATPVVTSSPSIAPPCNDNGGLNQKNLIGGVVLLTGVGAYSIGRFHRD